MTVYEIMRYCRNYFPSLGKKQYGAFKIEDGTIELDNVEDGQLFLVEGSQFNDGVYEYPTESLRDEQFIGYITPLNPPPDFLMLCKDIMKWEGENGNKMTSPFASESFGGYSYSKLMVNGQIAGWQDVFARRLREWRKV